MGKNLFNGPLKKKSEENLVEGMTILSASLLVTGLILLLILIFYCRRNIIQNDSVLLSDENLDIIGSTPIYDEQIEAPLEDEEDIDTSRLPSNMNTSECFKYPSVTQQMVSEFDCSNLEVSKE